MKKTFSLLHPKINVDRRVEAIKHEIKKYQTRERKKPLPAEADFWGFDCRFGNTEADAVDIHVAEINKKIDAIHAQGLTSFYLEVMAVPQQRTARPVEDPLDDDSNDIAEDEDIENN
ncbi:DUF6172 family protein [Reinekea sp. G2M2-21]|uniref:DUF6172 family protein n=1 Tax=Reinekea sp. G2M2-21 TaxID=2788942 RepID=UPI0018AC3B77|nr:DUF6172 family protein [Reinekea sp. G2M2-21]